MSSPLLTNVTGLANTFAGVSVRSKTLNWIRLSSMYLLIR